MSGLRTVLADDNALVRTGLRLAFERSSGKINLIGEFATGLDLMRGVAGRAVDVALLDVKMPVLDGITTARRLSRSRPEIAIVMYTAFADDSFLAEALRAGARGFLTKDISTIELIRRLQEASSGRSVFSALPTEILAEFYTSHVPRVQHDPEFEHRIRSLTAHHRDVFEFMAAGMSNKQIASQLHVTYGSAKTYASEVLQLVGCDSRAELIARALTAGANGYHDSARAQATPGTGEERR